MSQFIKGLFYFLLLAILASIAHYFWGEKFCGTCSGWSVANQKIEKPQFVELSIADADGSSVFKFPQGFFINAKDGTVEIPESLLGFKDSIFNYLNKNQGKELVITGKYLVAEGEPRGLDRANFLKDVLVKFGINGDKIIPKALLADYSYDANEKNAEGISMVFQNMAQENIEKYEQGITNKTLYADFGSNEFKPDNTLQSYALELKNYLETHPDKKAVITGHTDDVGEAKSNYNLGLKRAKNVLDYLVSQGIATDKLSADSKGETEPIADNATEEGRALNRRMTIVVQ